MPQTGCVDSLKAKANHDVVGESLQSLVVALASEATPSYAEIPR
jgi:hypothetical protein